MTESTDITSSESAGVTGLTGVVVPLLKGVVYQEDNPSLWRALLDLQTRLRDYINVLGLQLIVDESEGYAYLRSQPVEDDEDVIKLPRLIARRPLSYPVSLLLALLRKKIAEADARGGETRMIVSRDEVVELLRVFLPEGTYQTRVVNQVDAYLNKLVNMGFMRPLQGQERAYEVRRILKAYVDAQWLAEFEERLAKYQSYSQTLEESAWDE